jgi:hypothetical protein
MILASCCEGNKAVRDLWVASQSEGWVLSDLLGSVRIVGADFHVWAPSYFTVRSWQSVQGNKLTIPSPIEETLCASLENMGRDSLD